MGLLLTIASGLSLLLQLKDVVLKIVSGETNVPPGDKPSDSSKVGESEKR